MPGRLPLSPGRTVPETVVAVARMVVAEVRAIGVAAGAEAAREEMSADDGEIATQLKATAEEAAREEVEVEVLADATAAMAVMPGGEAISVRAPTANGLRSDAGRIAERHCRCAAVAMAPEL